MDLYGSETTLIHPQYRACISHDNWSTFHGRRGSKLRYETRHKRDKDLRQGLGGEGFGPGAVDRTGLKRLVDPRCTLRSWYHVISDLYSSSETCQTPEQQEDRHSKSQLTSLDRRVYQRSQGAGRTRHFSPHAPHPEHMSAKLNSPRVRR